MAAKRTTVMLSDEAWAAISEMAAIEEKSTTDLCAYLLDEYVMDQSRIIYKVPKHSWIKRSQRTLYVPAEIWPSLKSIKAMQRRTLSDILEQLIRQYTGLEIGQMVL